MPDVALMDNVEIEGLEAHLELSDHSSGMCVQIHGESYWTTLTFQDTDTIADIRNWFVEYCKRAGID